PAAADRDRPRPLGRSEGIAARDGGSRQRRCLGVKPDREDDVRRMGLVVALLTAVPGAVRAELQETPFFARDVTAGKLATINERLPSDPAVAGLETVGKPGGELRMLMSGPKDTRMMVVYGYARLVGYTPALKLLPDILASVDVEDGRVFTLHLRRGH